MDNEISQQCLANPATCSERESELQFQQIHTKVTDERTENLINSSISAGIIIGLIGLVILISPLIKPLHKFIKLILKIVVVGIVPITLVLLISYAVSFPVSAALCPKTCDSTGDQFFVATSFLLPMIITVPLAMKFYKKHRLGIEKRIDKLNTIFWLVLGLAVILLSAISTISGIKHHREVGETLKSINY